MVVYRNNSTDTTSMSDIYITGLRRKAKNLWVGTYNGLNKFDPKTNRFTRLKYQISKSGTQSNNHISAIYGDSKGRIWIGTTSAGLCIYELNTKKFKRVPCKQSAYAETS